MAAKNVLTTAQMVAVKGGVSINASATGLANANSAVTIPGAADDDKRRERPGGGVSTQ